MKQLPINKIVEDLAQVGFIITLENLKHAQIDVPIVGQVEILLSMLDEKGMKLTAKGKLPSKIVKEIAHCHPSLSEESMLSMSKRYIEDEQRTAQRTRNLCEVAKLVRVSKGKMLQGSMYKAYFQAPLYVRYLYLLDNYRKLNLGYFDGHQEEDITVRMLFIMMQTVRDKQKSFRPPAVYLAFVVDTYPMLIDDIEAHIDVNGYLTKDAYETFEGIVSLRLFQNFLLPFGLVEERGAVYGETYEVQKTALLESLLLPYDAIEIETVLNKKRLGAFNQRAKQLGIDTLYDDFCYLYMKCMDIHFFSPKEEAKAIVSTKQLLGTIVEEQEMFYEEFARAIIETFKYFTQLETKGGGNLDMQKEFESLIDGLYATIPKSTPFVLAKSIVTPILFFAQNLSAIYKIQMQEQDFAGQIQKQFNEEVIEDIGAFLYSSEQVERKLQKIKRVNKDMQAKTKEIVILMVLAVMSVHTCEKDGV